MGYNLRIRDWELYPHCLLENCVREQMLTIQFSYKLAGKFRMGSRWLNESTLHHLEVCLIINKTPLILHYGQVLPFIQFKERVIKGLPAPPLHGCDNDINDNSVENNDSIDVIFIEWLNDFANLSVSFFHDPAPKAYRNMALITFSCNSLPIMYEQKK